MIAFWLLPAEPKHRELSQLIAALARKHDAPTFQPHATVHVSDVSPDAVPKIVAELAAEIAPVTFPVRGTEHSEKFTKTLFVQLEKTAAAQQLVDAISRRVGKEYELNPHVSLLYKHLGEDERAAEAARIALPFTAITFEDLSAIEFREPITNHADVETWRTIASAKLAG